MKKDAFEPSFTLDFVSRALGIPAPLTPGIEGEPAPFKSVTTDSRKISAGCLFVALKGDQFDGHDFIPKAIEQGARGVLCARAYSGSRAAGVTFFVVENPLEAYRKLATAWRREFSIPVLVVAGSVGKTSTKELLASILSGKYAQVLKTQGSQNGYVGIPMTLLELRAAHQAAVIEVGIDEVGAMEKHMELVGATASVLTTIGPEHLEKLHDLPTVAREEGVALTHVAQSGGVVAISLDDPWIKPHFTTLRTGRKMGYTLGTQQSPAPLLLVGKIDREKNRLQIAGGTLGESVFPLPLPGEHNARNCLAAIAIAHAVGLDPSEIQAGLKSFARSADAYGRSEMRELPDGSPVVCDYYNANPTSTEAGLELLAQIAGQAKAARPRWACLADMLELGTLEEQYHRGLADKILALSIENVLLYGERMRWLEDELKKRGFKGKLAHYPSHSDLAAELRAKRHAGEAILIKGSRGMKMEEVWKRLA